MGKQNRLLCITAVRERTARLVACLLLAVTSVGCSPAAERMVAPETVTRPEWRPIDANPASAAQLGQEVLEKIGYDRLISIARQAGYVTTSKGADLHRNNGALLAMDGALPAEVFSRYAVAAGVTSQVDSPLPGPADVVALGILVIGLIHAGLLVDDILGDPGSTTAPPAVTTPPVPPAAPATTAAPRPTVVAPPIAVPQTCGNTYPGVQTCSSLPGDYTFPSVGLALNEIKKKLGDKGLSLHNEAKTKSGPCPGAGLHYNVRQGGERAGSITCCPCCMEGPPGPKVSMRCRIHSRR